MAFKPKVASILNSEGALTKSDLDTANAFNVRYIFHPPSLLNMTQEILNSSLPRYSSPDPDGISNVLLKEGGFSLVMAIVYFFRQIV